MSCWLWVVCAALCSIGLHCCIVQCTGTLYIALLHCTLHCCAVLCTAALHSEQVALHGIWHGMALHHFALYCIAVHCNPLVEYWTAMHCALCSLAVVQCTALLLCWLCCTVA